MEHYKNLGRDSGVAGFEIGPDFIKSTVLGRGNLPVYDCQCGIREHRAYEATGEKRAGPQFLYHHDRSQTVFAKRAIMPRHPSPHFSIEQRRDLLLSTLRGYVESLEGELELNCRFKNSAAVWVKPGQNAKTGRKSPSRWRSIARRS